MTETNGQLRAFIERVIDRKSAARDINDDIRAIYAEAKDSGFDKTVLGKLVSYIQKRTQDASAVAESDAMFDLYLAEYDKAEPHVHAHAPARIAGPSVTKAQKGTIPKPKAEVLPLIANGSGKKSWLDMLPVKE